MKKNITENSKKSKKCICMESRKIGASILAANAITMSFPVNVLAASNITGVTPDGNTYNIEAAKVSGATGFRQYADFTLDNGDIANLIFKNGQQNFVNLVDNQININGIVNTMQGTNFYNGHAIFVSPAGMIVGASGVLNVGSLTMMAPSQNAYNSFKTGLTANDYKNMADYNFDLKNENYKSLITNSSGTITVNGRIFAREGINAYARTINISKDLTSEISPSLFAGAKNNTEVIDTQEKADTLFNSLVANNITNATGFNLEDGKIKLVTNKAQQEIITSVFTSEETVNKNNNNNNANTGNTENNNNNNNVEKKKYQNTTTINVSNGLKTTEKKEVKADGKGESTTEQTIDSTYENSSLSSEDSTISISDANIAANEVEIEANAELTKEVTEEGIKAYSEAEKKAASVNNNNNSDSNNNNSENNNNNTNTTTQDSTSGYKIHESAMGVADEAKASVSISNSKIKADTVSVNSNAKNNTETYIQLLTPLWEKWVALLGQDLAIRLVGKLLDVLPNGEDSESLDDATKQVIQEMIGNLPWQSRDAVVTYFSSKMYTYFDGARAASNISVIGSEIKAASSVDITSNADATLKLTTGNLDSHALLLYGLGSGTESKVNVSGSTISAINGVYDAQNNNGDEVGTGSVLINAFSTIDHSIDYDSSNFRTIVDNNGSTTGNASGYNFSLLNNSISSDNNVTVSDGSNIEAANIDVKAIGFNKSDIKIQNVSNVGENAERSGISMSMLINHTDTKADVAVNGSTLKANYRPAVTKQEVDLENTTDENNPVMKDVTYEYGNARFLAENIETIQNKVETKVQAKKQEYSINTKEMANFSPTYTIKLYDWLNKKFLNKASNKVGSLIDKAHLEFSGSAIWNDEINEASSKLNGATVNADNISVNSNILDFNTNAAVADAAANSKLGGGAAIIVNSRNNTNIAEIINNSVINAATTVSVDAQTQLPMNPLTLKVGTKSGNKDYYIGASFDEGDGTDKWDTEFIHSDLMELLGVIGKNANKQGFQNFLKAVKSPKKTIGNLQTDMDGLLNNYAKAQTGGQYSGIAGSVIANSIENNTTAKIDSSNVIAANGDVLVNAVNSVVNNDGAGKVEFMITEINDFLSSLKNGTPEQQLEASKFGMGGSVLVQNFTNNATATINKSKVTAENGNVDVLSASEEGYINIAITGAKAQNVAIEGSVSVQNINGTTKASIEAEENTEKLVKAKNVNVKAGSAKARTKAKTKGSALLGVAGESLVINPVTHELVRSEARDSKDGVLNITIFGTNAMNSGTGVSVGASVDVSQNSKQVNSLVDKAKITAAENINITASSYNKKIDVLTSGAFTSGVQTSNLPNVGNSQDGGSTRDITGDANDNNQSLTNNQSLLDGNNPNQEGAENSEGTTGDATQLAEGVANILTGDDTSSSRNFSASLAGTVSVFNDKSAVTTVINNAVLNLGNEISATTDKDNFLLNVSGGVAKGDNIGGGAAVNIYSNKGTVSADITGGTITFNSNNAKKLNVTATSNHFITDVAMGVGIAGEDSSFGAAVGGSFNTNTLKDTTSAKMTGTTVSKKSGAANDIDVNVAANTESKIYNVAGEVGYSNSETVALGAGVAGNMDVLEQVVLSQITGNLSDVKNTYIDSVLKQHIRSTSVAGEIVSGDTTGFNIGGALGLELIKNRVSALLGDGGNSTIINSSGDVRVKAESVIDGFTATGSLNVATTGFSFGAGIGAIVDIDSSEITAKVDNAKVKKSKSLEVKANSSDKRDFVAANLGGQLSEKGSFGITANGIVSVLKSKIHAQVLNGSQLATDGALDINSSYVNNFKGITAVGEGAQKGGAIGANVLVNHFGNDVLTEISNNSSLTAGNNIGISAKTAATLNLIPAAVSIAASGITALAADVSVDIVKDKTQALAKGNMTAGGNLTVGADDETTLLNRGGTLAAASPKTLVNISGAVNVDKIEKTVNAQIGTDEQGSNKSVVKAENGKVSVSAVSTNSLGGTKNTSNGYDRDDITSAQYQNRLLTKDSEGNFNGINYSNSFGNWNMFYNVAAGSQVTIPGTVVIKNIQNSVNAKVLNTELTAKNMNITANDYSVKNIVSGEIAGAKLAAVGAQVYITKDNSTTTSIIGKNSDITVANTLNITAWNRKDNKLVFAAAGGAGKAAVETNVLKNTINDDTIAKVETSSTVTAGTLNISSEEDVNASRIVVAASGSANASIDVSPLINYYGDTSTAENRHGKTVAEISNSTINNAVIGMNADTNIRTQDIAIDAGGAGTGFAGSGTAIKNTYNTITKSIIDSNTTINNAQNIRMNANSVFDSRNYAIGASGDGVGANLVANVILNDFLSKTETSISDSSITAKSIEMKTNKDKKDNLINYGIAGGFAAKGLSAVVTTIYDVFNNESISKVVNSSITTTDNGGLTLDANSQRTMKNHDISASLAGIGFGGAASALVTKNDSKTQSYIDAKTGNNINVAGQLYLNATDSTIANNTLGVGGGGLVSGIACVNLYTANNLVKSEILSQTGASAIKSGSAYVGAESTNAIRNLAVGAAAGLVSLAADVQLIKIGKFGSTYTETEQESHINDAIKETKKGYDKIATDEEKARYNPEADTTQTKTGVIANINANMENSGALEMKAKSNIKGVDKNGNLTDTLDLTNVDVSVGGTAPNAAVKNLKVANDTTATISGGNITSGDISINAESNSNVKISSTGVTVSAVALSGGSSIYKNNSNTLAQIGSDNGNTTINANNISVNTKSTSKSDLTTRAVGVRVAGIAGVNILENIDNNSSLAKITGNTNITANGDLSTHSTINTDLKSRQNTVEVAGADIAAVFRNETTASTISKAVVEAVTGTIKSKNINIVSDYGVMKIANTVDSTKVKAANVVAHDKAIVNLNATFESGINAGNAVIQNSGNLKIETAKKSGSENITATNTLDEVTATIANFFSGTFGETYNTAKSNTYLVGGNNSTGSLTINSYLDSLAKTTTGVRKGGAISVNSAYAESKDTSTLNLIINGTNKITGSAVINAIHNANVSSDLEALNVGIGVQGQRARVSANQTSNTIGTISGDYSANSSEINFNTNRNSYISKTTKSGGAISVNDASSNNTLDGNSTLNINITNASTDLNNKMIVKNTSTNTFDIKSSDSSGGVINISLVNDNTTLNTRTTTNITNADIKAKGDVSFEVANNTLVDDTGTSRGGGFVAVLDSTYKRTYTSGAYLNLTNSEIHANDIKLNAHSDISARRKNEFDFKAGGGGFVAISQLELRNWLNQTSVINLTNSKLYANNDAVLSADTSSWFKVKSNTDGRGFVSVPKVWSYLDPTYNQTINLDSTSIIDAANNAVFNFNSNNTLSSKVSSYAANFAGPPSAYSWLNLNINNTLNNQGTIKAGKLADINFMNKSYNDLANHIDIENRASVAKTWEDGNLLKRVINKLQVPNGAEIVSNKDIEVTYSGGRNNFDSRKHWKTISYIVFGIPIKKEKTTNPVSNIVGNSLELNGLMKAGSGSSKKITINKDGSINEALTEGFRTNEYSLSGGQAEDGKAIKDKKLAEINSKINSAASHQEEIVYEIVNLEDSKETKEIEKEDAENIVADFQSLVDGDYKLLNNKAQGDTDSSEFTDFIINDFKFQIVGSQEEGKLTEAQYNAFIEAYGKELSATYEYNEAHPEEPKEYTHISDFLAAHTNLGISEEQGLTLVTAYATMESNNPETEILTENGNFTTYTSFDGVKYAGVLNPTEVSGVKSCDEVAGLADKIDTLTKDINAISETITSYETASDNIGKQILDLGQELTEVANTPESEFGKSKYNSYSILFNSIKSQDSTIRIDGMTNNYITGSGNFIVSEAGVQIDNYSTRSLVFNDIDLGSSSGVGLVIDQKSYQEFLNAEQAVNGTNAYEYKYPRNFIFSFMDPVTFNQVGTSGAHYKADSTSIKKGIVINNYYDIANPFAASQQITNPKLVSDIKFNGQVVTNGVFDVFNDSGSIYLNNFNADNIRGAVNIAATKGNVDFNSSGQLKLNEGNNIFAGNAVNIKAGSVNSSANITAGYNKDLTLTITDDMLNNLLIDPVTGERTLINLGSTPYASAANNVKALYKDGKIYLFNINKEVKGTDISQKGKIDITSSGTNSIVQNKLKTYDGYQNINIQNNTNKELIVNDITNIKSLGGLYINDAKQTGNSSTTLDSAITNVNTKGALTIAGVVKNAVEKQNGKVVFDSSANGLASSLVLQSQGGGLELKKQTIKDIDNLSLNSIYATGDVTLRNDNPNAEGSVESSANMNIAGDIEVQGNIYLTQDTKGVMNVNSEIRQKKHYNGLTGVIELKNQNASSEGGILLDEDTFLYNENGNINIKNHSTGTVVTDGLIYAPKGGFTIESGGTVIHSATSAVHQAITIGNDGENQIVINGMNITDSGDINVNNLYGQLWITDDGGLINYSTTPKSINIRNATEYGMDIDGVVGNYSGGDINIENLGGDAEISGLIENKPDIENITNGNITGNINIINHGGDLTISGDVETEQGNIKIENYDNAESNKLNIVGDILAEKGNIDIKNNGDDAYISRYLHTGDGNITINNNKNDIEISSAIETNNGKVTINNTGNNAEISGIIAAQGNDANGGINIINNGGDLTISCDIETEQGNIKIENYDNAKSNELYVIGDITAEKGNIDITNNGDDAYISSYLYTGDGNITINNNKNDVEISSAIETNNGKVTINNTGNNAEISGIIAAQSNDASGGIFIENGQWSVEPAYSQDLTISGELYLNPIDETKSGTISILNNNKSGKLDIISAEIKAQGTQTGIYIKNYSRGDSKLTIEDSNITQKDGNIQIINNYTDLTIKNGSIENNNNTIYIESGEYKYNDGTVIKTNIDTNIKNANGDIELWCGDHSVNTLSLDGSIKNENGGIYVLFSGSSADVKSYIENYNGRTSITNREGGALIVSSDILNNDGELLLRNKNVSSDDMYDSSSLEILGNIVNVNGDINIRNTQGTINIDENASIQNVSNDDNAHAFNIETSGTKFDMNGSIGNNLGGITIKNSRGTADIAGEIETDIGDISITNTSDAGALNISGNIENVLGKFEITNNSSYGMVIDSTANIINNDTKNTVITNTQGSAIIENGAKIVNTTGGDISVTNSGVGIAINGLIENQGTGKITVDSTGTGALTIGETSSMKTKDGDISISNSNTGALTVSGNIANETGAITITNNSSDGMTVNSRTNILNNDTKNTVITNTQGSALIENGAKIVNATGGDISVTNSGVGIAINGLIENQGTGSIAVNNTGTCDLIIGEASSMKTKDGDISISNSGENADISGNIGSNNGSVTIDNAKNNLNVTANIDSIDGIVAITNAENAGTFTISSKIKTLGEGKNGIAVAINNQSTKDDTGLIIDNSTITSEIGDIIINNTNNDLIIIGGMIENTKEGNISISNLEGDLTASTDIYTKEGDIGILNFGGDLISSSEINNEEGDIEIVNDNEFGTLQLDGSIINQNGNTSITNTGIDAEIEAGIVNNGGDITIETQGYANVASAILNSDGNISVNNSVNENCVDDGLNISGTIVNTNGKIDISNLQGDLYIDEDAHIANIPDNSANSANSMVLFNALNISNDDNDITVSNSGEKLIIDGIVEHLDKGDININNFGSDALAVNDTSMLHTTDGNIEIVNSSTEGIDLTGLIRADKQNVQITNSNSDLRIGSYADFNDKYITTLDGNVIINQTKGNILNSIIDVVDDIHQNYDLGNPNEEAYKTLISANGDITFNVTDGDVGEYDSIINSIIPAGTSFDASTRDYTDSINVQATGTVNAKVVNDTNADDRLINIRAKQSDLKAGTIETDGNVLLTAVDWRQADIENPAENNTDDTYYTGYSILNGNAEGDNSSNIIAKNISLIASNTMGTKDKKLINEEDTLHGGNNVSLNVEAENGLYLTGRVNSDDGKVKLNNLITKHGDVHIDFESDAEIEHITADEGLVITQKAKNLTIKEFGTSRGLAALLFDDILYPHDDIIYDAAFADSLIPKYVDIKVLDAMNNPDSADSTLKIYTGLVRGNNGNNAEYYPNGARLADITLMADNIYAFSDKMQTPAYSDRIDLGDTGLKYELDGDIRTAKGLNAYGEGDTLTIDILGVDKDIVEDLGLAANRTSYNSEVSIGNTPSKFHNSADEIPFYGSDYSAKNVVLSANDYSDRDVNFDTLYTNNAYLNINKDSINLDNVYVNNFAEIKTNNKIAVVDNERIDRLEHPDIQLYTKKTGSFALNMDETINMHTTAPTVYNNPHMLVNGYHSEWNFVNNGFKQTQVQVKGIQDSIKAKMENELKVAKPMMVVFDVSGNLTDLNSDTKIYSISTTGALINNDKNLKNGDTTQLNFTIDGLDVTIEAKVIDAEGGVAQVEFINVPRSLANKLLYRYMQANSEDMNLTSL